MLSYLALILIVIGLCLLPFVVLYIIFYKEIWSFLKPRDWVMIELLELDNHVNTWLQKKTDDLTFQFNGGSYNMFEMISNPRVNNQNKANVVNDSNGNKIPVIPSRPEDKEIKRFSAIYRSGRLAKMYFVEGNQNPIDFRTGDYNQDAQLTNQLEKVKISELLHSGGGLGEELWNKFGFFILIGVGVLLLILVFKK